jgi:two-component system chemotaxis sensor kinase CheA
LELPFAHKEKNLKKPKKLKIPVNPPIKIKEKNYNRGLTVEELDLEIALDFINEAKDLTSEAEESILALEDGEDPDNHLSNIFRMAHNIKGSGRAVGFTTLGDFVHVFEDVIGMIRTGDINLNPGIISLLLEGNDTVNKFLDALEDDPNGTYDTSDCEAKLSFLKENKTLPGEGQVLAASESPMTESKKEETVQAQAPTALDEGDEKMIKDFESSLESSIPEPKVGPEKKPAPPAPPKAAAPEKNVLQFQDKGDGNGGSDSKKSAKKASDEFLKVRLSKLDAIIDSLGELLIYQSMLNERRKGLSGPEFLGLNNVVDALNGITKEMQDVTINLRMLPLQNVFSKMNRIVRELVVLQGKKINFQTAGEHIELDKIIVDSLGNPLTHMIRNAIDHGIETPEERVAAGKPEEATVELSATLDAGVVRIHVKDDGRGLNRDKILQKALANGLVGENTAANLSDQEVYRFIFESGFSTKDQVTDLSGRGVGMDVVRSTIESLSGSIDINSVWGEGTHFSIQLPLSLSIVEAMLIHNDGERYIIPLSQLWETIEIDYSKIGFLNDEAMVLKVREEEIPLFSLSDTLKSRGGRKDMEESPIGIVTSVDNNKYAFAVDRIVGTQSVVVKDLGVEFSQLTGLAGSAILGDGQPGLILDLTSLISSKALRKVA